MTFSARLAAAVRATGAPLCVGVDPHPAALPEAWGSPTERALRFGRAVIAASTGRAALLKPQFAFFEALGPAGMTVLATLCAEARAAGLLVLGDAKRGDIGTTAAAYAAATLAPDAPFGCDALTVNPFLGPDTLAPFLDAVDRHGAGLFVLLRTSNPGSARFQEPVYERLCDWLDEVAAPRLDDARLSPVGAVVGATHRDAVAATRARLPHTWMLLPGFGAQGAGVDDVRAAIRPDGLGAMVSASRAATFPPAAPAGAADPEREAWIADPATWMATRIDAVRAALR